MMDPLKEYDISFSGMKLGKYQYEYNIDNQFFESLNYDEFFNVDVKVELEFVKKATLFELFFKSNGIVEVACDVSNEKFNQDIESTLETVVKFGSEFNNDNEDLIIIPRDEHKINVAQFIYEMIILAIPTKKIHPGIEDGTLKSEVLEKLKDYQPGSRDIKNENDPRWDELKKLLTNKNT